MNYRWFYLSIALVTVLVQAQAQLNVPSDGSDGALNVNSSTTIDLGSATTAAWNTPGNGNGVYDPNKWAVVYKYSSVNINSGGLRFANHPSGAPVVWLVQGDVVINANITLLPPTPRDSFGFANPGPGGFRGGRALTNIVSPGGSAGLGPGGSRYVGHPPGNAGHSTQGTGPGGGPAYGNPQIVPLIGGSGGAGSSGNPNWTGSTGGGAILIVASGRIRLNGSILARSESPSGGFGGGGSGGSVRLIADRLEGSGAINTGGGNNVFGGSGTDYGSLGRVRIEVNHTTYTGSITGSLSTAPPGNPPLIWPPEGAPSVQIAQVAGQNAPSDPSARFDQPDMTAATSGQTTIKINAQNVPGNWTVQLRVVRFAGNDFTVNATRISGDDTNSVWEATLTLPPGMLALQVRAFAP